MAGEPTDPSFRRQDHSSGLHSRDRAQKHQAGKFHHREVLANHNGSHTILPKDLEIVLDIMTVHFTLTNGLGVLPPLQLREAFPEDRAPQYLILDRDVKFSGEVATMLGTSAVS